MKIANRLAQTLRVQLDRKISEAAYDLFHQDGTPAKGIDKMTVTDDESSFRFYASGGYTYEVSIKPVAWPGMNEKAGTP